MAFQGAIQLEAFDLNHDNIGGETKSQAMPIQW